MKASLSALEAHAVHLEALSKNSRARATGWTYDQEVLELRAATKELKLLREIVATSAPYILGSQLEGACYLYAKIALERSRT